MKKFLFFALFVAAIACTQTACNNQPEQPNEQPRYEYFYYEEPSFEWGASKSNIKKWMSDNGYKLISEETEGGYVCITYDGKYEEEYTILMFDAQSLAYTSAIVYIDSYQTKISDFLHERHGWGGTDDYLLTRDGKTMIFTDLQELPDAKGMLYVVTYCPAE